MEVGVAIVALILAGGMHVVTFARLWGKFEQRFNGFDKSLERIETGNAAVCVEHREQLHALKEDVNRHEEWLVDHTDLLANHGDRLIRLEASRADG